MSCQRRIKTINTDVNTDDSGVWSFADINGDGTQDFVNIKTRNTDSGMIEVYGCHKESDSQQHSQGIVTGFDTNNNGTWLMQDFTGDGKADLICIKTHHTGAVELHVADAASSYQNVVCYTTSIGCENNGIWTMSRNGDLAFIKTRNCDTNKIEYHVASKKKRYQEFTQHDPTDFDAEDNGTWCPASNYGGDPADLYYIKSRNTESTPVEVHVVSTKPGRRNSRLVYGLPSFVPKDNGQCLLVNLTHQRQPDLAYITTSCTRPGKIDIHIVPCDYQAPVSPVSSELPQSTSIDRLTRMLRPPCEVRFMNDSDTAVSITGVHIVVTVVKNGGGGVKAGPGGVDVNVNVANEVAGMKEVTTVLVIPPKGSDVMGIASDHVLVTVAAIQRDTTRPLYLNQLVRKGAKHIVRQQHVDNALSKTQLAEIMLLATTV